MNSKEDGDELEKVEGKEEDATVDNKLKILSIIFYSLAIISSFIIILVNLILIARLNPSLKTKIGPDSFIQNDLKYLPSKAFIFKYVDAINFNSTHWVILR